MGIIRGNITFADGNILNVAAALSKAEAPEGYADDDAALPSCCSPRKY
jgi:hypothetical protein